MNDDGERSLGDLREEATTSLYLLVKGDASARNALFQLLYHELHRIASALMASERDDHTLQPTALVHEAWFRLIDRSSLKVSCRAEFLGVAAQAMRRVLVDHARRRSSLKNAGGHKKTELLLQPDARKPSEVLNLIAVDEALKALETLGRESERLVKFIELRFFAGLSQDETAETLGLSRSTAARDWRRARAWLKVRLHAACGEEFGP